MYGDGTRRFSESEGSQPEIYDRLVRKRDRDGWESIGVAIENRPDYPPTTATAGFLHYDGTMSYLDNPPNQHYQIQNFPRPRRPLRPPA